jgi:hypothetical protein
MEVGAREGLGENEESDKERRWNDKVAREKKGLHIEWIEAEHPGCQLTGHLLWDRTPGNFHVLARSQNQEFAAHMANASHMVNSLSVDDPMAKHLIATKQRSVPKEVSAKMSPMDGNIYTTVDLHEAYHHYIIWGELIKNCKSVCYSLNASPISCSGVRTFVPSSCSSFLRIVYLQNLVSATVPYPSNSCSSRTCELN